jgi:hypothetical protein
MVLLTCTPRSGPMSKHASLEYSSDREYLSEQLHFDTNKQELLSAAPSGNHQWLHHNITAKCFSFRSHARAGIDHCLTRRESLSTARLSVALMRWTYHNAVLRARVSRA